MSKPTYKELEEMIGKLEDHLGYCGWGDSWERECSEELQQELAQLKERLTLS